MPLVLHSLRIAVGVVDHVLCPTPSQYLIGSSMYFPLRLRILPEGGWCPETLQPLPVPLAALSARAGSYRLVRCVGLGPIDALVSTKRFPGWPANRRLCALLAIAIAPIVRG